MDQEIKARWLAKLESGEYEQTTEHLATSDGYCCLGVLCEIAVEDGIVFKAENKSESNLTGKTVYSYISKLDAQDSSESVLPMAVMEWSKIGSTNPGAHLEFDGVEYWEYLSELNDEHKKTFPEIAEVIREKF